MAAPRALQSITVPATTAHTATVIFLHGLGDSGAGWAPVARLLARNPKLHHVKWILPHAPVQRVTLNFGMSMPSWFDIASLDADLMSDMSADGIRSDRAEDQEGILKSAMAVGGIISGEVDAGIDSKRVVVGGFSQGAALSLVTGLTSERRLGGLACLSGWLPMSGKMKSMMTDAARTLPIFFGHGEKDPVVQFKYGKKSYDFLKEALKFKDAEGEDVKGLSWNEYPDLEHSSSPEELKDLEKWLEKVLPADVD